MADAVPPARCERCDYRGTLFRWTIPVLSQWLCGRCMFGIDRRSTAA